MSRRRKRIAVVTGTRAEFGLLRSTLAAIQAEPRLVLGVVIAGMHLLKRHGYTAAEVLADGWPVIGTAPMQRGDEDPLDPARGLARGVARIAEIIADWHAHAVCVLGDRVEALAGALAGAATRRHVVHIHGGDVALGETDDRYRHAITKLADVHLVASRDAARRVRRMGERPDRVFLVGAPGLDDIRAFVERTRAHAAAGGEAGAFTDAPYALVIFHPTGRSPSREKADMLSILRGVERSGLSGVVVYPNSDPGASGIIAAIRTRRRSPRWRVFRSLSRERFLAVFARAHVLVGNSSAGIIESAAIGTPAINIGDRQAGRLRPKNYVFDAPADADAIAALIRRLLTSRWRPRRVTPYGDGQAGRRIAAILAAADFPLPAPRKQITC